MSLTLLNWRREVAAMYRDVRAEQNPQLAHELWMQRRDDLFLFHPDSALSEEAKASFTGLPYGPYDAALRFESEVDTDVDPISFSAETGTDGVVTFKRFGCVHLESVGSLDLWWLESYGGGVFVPFADKSPNTYGGGRYLLDTVKGADLGGDVDLKTGKGTLVLDLNFAYNPSCAYDPAWACPLAPAGNRIPVPVEAGEHHLDD